MGSARANVPVHPKDACRYVSSLKRRNVAAVSAKPINLVPLPSLFEITWLFLEISRKAACYGLGGNCDMTRLRVRQCKAWLRGCIQPPVQLGRRNAHEVASAIKAEESARQAVVGRQVTAIDSA